MSKIDLPPILFAECRSRKPAERNVVITRRYSKDHSVLHVSLSNPAGVRSTRQINSNRLGVHQSTRPNNAVSISIPIAPAKNPSYSALKTRRRKANCSLRCSSVQAPGLRRAKSRRGPEYFKCLMFLPDI